MRDETKTLKKDYDKTEDDLKALQSVGQIIGEVLRQLDGERFIVKASSGPRYVVGCRNKIEKEKLIQGTRVSLDMTTLTIMRNLPREVDPVVFNMLTEDPGNVSYGDVGGAPPARRTRACLPSARRHVLTCAARPRARQA